MVFMFIFIQIYVRLYDELIWIIQNTHTHTKVQYKNTHYMSVRHKGFGWSLTAGRSSIALGTANQLHRSYVRLLMVVQLYVNVVAFCEIFIGDKRQTLCILHNWLDCRSRLLSLAILRIYIQYIHTYIHMLI